MGKLTPPHSPAGVIVRARLMHRLDAMARLGLVVAPPGYGKTVLAEQWRARSALPAAWLSLDLLDHNPVTFWLDFLRAVRTVLPAVDHEAEVVLSERPHDGSHLGVLIAQIEAVPGQAVVILDDLSRLTDATVLDGLGLLVERIGDRLKLVITARADPLLPLARWRALGWVADVRGRDLRFDNTEALEVASHVSGLELAAGTVVDVNRRVDGWPIALHLGLVAARGADDPERRARAVVESDRSVAELLVREILDPLSAEAREVALDLAVADWFDPHLAHALAGPRARLVVAELKQRQLLLDSIAGRPDALRFHALVRELLESELKWRDPERHAALHRVAAEACRQRGDLNAAHRHLTTIGDHPSADELVLRPILQALDDGDAAAFTRVVGALPEPANVDEQGLAHDLAIAWFLARDRVQAGRWAERVESLTDPSRPADELRLHALRGLLAFYDGGLDEAAIHVAAVENIGTDVADVGPVTRRFPLVAARVALARADLTAARRWLGRLRAVDLPDGHRVVTVPAIEAWYELTCGRLTRAGELVGPACDWLDRREVLVHHGVLEAHVTAAWCSLAVGNFSDADEHASAARVVAELQTYDWNRLRAGIVAAEVRMLIDGPQAALAVVHDVRSSLDDEHTVLAGRLATVEAAALNRLGRSDEAEVILGDRDDAAAQLVRASVALAAGAPEGLPALLDGAESWLPDQRIAAHLLLAAGGGAGTSSRLVAAALEEAAEAGWVTPFLGHGPHVEALLLSQPLERLHPRLAEHLRRPPPTERSNVTLHEALTAREHTILELLPSHLSYAEIATRLFLSVNTVKSNLKSIYRKLSVASRSEAVDAARTAGLM